MATIKKAGPGPKPTAMQKLKSIYPKADTMPKGDLRFQDMGPMDRYNKADQNRINATNKAFDAKYGKDKLAMKKGGSVKKASSMKMKNGGSMKKPLASGVAGKTPKAGMVDPKGAYTKVQTRTLGNMKSGGKMSKKK